MDFTNMNRIFLMPNYRIIVPHNVANHYALHVSHRESQLRRG
jgi:hypothetical protein